jgi:DNA repair protein RecN (Recombination protein N)
MLRELSVQNMALIEDVRVELQPGFCAWTGETGAGKTLLLAALGLLLGERGSSELLRADAPELRVVGRFELGKPSLRQAVEAILQAPLDDEQLILMRRLSSNGRSFAYVNDQPVTLTTLKQLGELLVDIHGQRESHSLLQPAYQLLLLDAFGDLEDLRGKYHVLADRVRNLRRRLNTLEADRQKRVRELALVRFEKEELDQAALLSGELRELAREREKFVHAQALQEFAGSVCEQLYDQDASFFETLGKLEREAERWAKLDAELKDVAQRLRQITSDTQEIVQTLRPWANKTQADPARLEEVENRLQLLRRLETKYGQPVEQLIAYRQTLDAQEFDLAGKEEDRTILEAELRDVWAQLQTIGAELSGKRKKSAKKMVAEVEKHLVQLGMPDAKLDADMQSIPLGADPLTSDVLGDGFEQLDILLAANRGEPARALRKVASGGELSRTMLALKSVLAGHDQIGTLIFDEIDANVGGRLGDVLGAKLAALGRTHQVICVTHLPQVASYARHQWTIRKERKGKRTATVIEHLDESNRLDELASMLRGSARGETTRKEAEAMLNAARKKW